MGGGGGCFLFPFCVPLKEGGITAKLNRLKLGLVQHSSACLERQSAQVACCVCIHQKKEEEEEETKQNLL